VRVLVCGGRTFDDAAMLDVALASVRPTHIITGGATGADRLAELWAAEHAVPSTVYPAEWDLHRRAAGPIRNRWMLYDGLPDLVLAFPGGRGTADMVRRATEAGVRVVFAVELVTGA